MKVLKIDRDRVGRKRERESFIREFATCNSNLVHFLEAIKVRISFTFLLFFVFNFFYLVGKIGKR